MNAEFSIEELHLAVLQALPEGMCFVDLRGAIRIWNVGAGEITGFSAAEAVCARSVTEVFFLSGPDGQPLLTVVDFDDGAIAYLRHKDGHSFPVAVWRLSVRTQDEAPMGTLIRFTVPESASRVAPMVGEDKRSSRGEGGIVAPSLRWPEGIGRPGGLLLIQIDGFDVVEHRLGPEAAEKVISLVERTTGHCLNTNETCWRLPGGSVLALVHSGERLGSLAQKLRMLIQSARFQWWGESVSSTVSIGGTRLGPHDTYEAAIRRVEDCIVRSSRSGGNQVLLADD
jgi:PAS domain S-box-containing protein